ncbi:GGDEF domain-containing protein [Methylopila sp. Yamaguchi]|uniref:GGDEF domain-containing protein n=1 Tax=Methylopila sp. Yamaguchi TaxID=1437817 RepID=UPI000CCAD0EC|nr:GGDEF domain-containing protein [Methylopila sp. Yamaguchi]GBD47419.1 diguanylate cyclase [Methylopila sp. Yamaguchi]
MSVMRRVLLRSTGVAFLSVALSLGLAVTVVPAVGGVVDGNAWLMCVLCPLLIAWPASAWQLWQHEQLRVARAALVAAHEELQRAHDALAETARRDGLTGLLNRESLLAVVEQARSSSAGAWLLVADLDHFKAINDRYGHAVGDDVLTQVASRLSSTLGEGDAVGRLGGEEFAVLLIAADERHAADAAERLRAAVARTPILVEGDVRLTVTISVGGAAIDPALPVREAYTRADARLYEAKRAGRDRVVVSAAPEVEALATSS